MSAENPITFHQSNDPELIQASEWARATFRYFWNQVALDFNRIIPAIELASLKVTFSDDFSDPNAPVEHMWVEQVYFDGVEISGVLINSPHWLKIVDRGDEVTFPLTQLDDWLCVLDGTVYGAHTVQVIRSRMNDEERNQYDNAWGLSFPSPDTVLIPDRNEKFEAAIAKLLSEQITKDPAIIETKFDRGRTLLHLECLYGRTPSVKVLLERGASPMICCDRGWTALDYARSLEWDDIVVLLENR